MNCKPIDAAQRIAALLLLVLLLCAGSSGAAATHTVRKPVGVTVKLHILKIYDINTVTQTFSIDGFLTLLWKAPEAERPYTPFFIIDDEEVADTFRRKVWWPNIDFINIQGERNVPYRRIVRDTAGNMTYTERFYATMSSKMDFKTFPFDHQRLQLLLESFGFGDTVMYFNRALGNVLNTDDIVIVEWTVTGAKSYAGNYRYKTHLRQGTSFSRFTIEVGLKRNPEYYIWQFFLPLGLLILLSWFIFWVSNAEIQISLAFTLMLTLVAYNFYSASYLPRLPYNTFIQSTVIAAYIVIFVLTALVVFKCFILARNRTVLAYRIDRVMKWLVPLITLIALTWIWDYFFH